MHQKQTLKSLTFFSCASVIPDALVSEHPFADALQAFGYSAEIFLGNFDAVSFHPSVYEFIFSDTEIMKGMEVTPELIIEPFTEDADERLPSDVSDVVIYLRVPQTERRYIDDKRCSLNLRLRLRLRFGTEAELETIRFRRIFSQSDG